MNSSKTVIEAAVEFGVPTATLARMVHGIFCVKLWHVVAVAGLLSNTPALFQELGSCYQNKYVTTSIFGRGDKAVGL